jgi:hypothetical protein
MAFLRWYRDGLGEQNTWHLSLVLTKKLFNSRNWSQNRNTEEAKLEAERQSSYKPLGGQSVIGWTCLKEIGQSQTELGIHSNMITVEFIL